MFDDLYNKLPFVVASNVKHTVHKFGSITPELLHFVYSTKPMCHVAPGELIDFSLSVEPTKQTSSASAPKKKTARQRKKQKEALALLRKKNKARLDAKRIKRELAPASKPIVCDDVFQEGLKWLDSLAGVSIEETKLDATFPDSVWKSPTRNLNDLS